MALQVIAIFIKDRIQQVRLLKIRLPHTLMMEPKVSQILLFYFIFLVNGVFQRVGVLIYTNGWIYHKVASINTMAVSCAVNGGQWGDDNEYGLNRTGGYRIDILGGRVLRVPPFPPPQKKMPFYPVHLLSFTILGRGISAPALSQFLIVNVKFLFKQF